MVERCTAINKDGTPCSAQAARGTLCRWHDPALANERAAWRAKGGANKSNKARAKKAAEGMELSELQGLLSLVLRGVITGRFTPGQATAAAALARAMVTIREAGEIEARLSQLEDAAGTKGKGRTA
jgi:hypothetical protein